MKNFANQTPMQVTLREMQHVFSSPRFWLGFVAAVGMLTIMGPFGTIDTKGFAARLVYWGLVSLLTFPTGYIASMYFSIVLERRGLPVLLARLLAGLIAGLPIAAIVWVLNLPSDWDTAFSPFYLLTIASYTVPVAAALSVIYYLATSAIHPEPESSAFVEPDTAVKAPPPSENPFLRRLPVELGKDLISLQAQDHYVRAVTTKGAEMVLIRLADAEAELAGMAGFRVHRSWWVADAHLDRIERREGKPMLILDNGTEIPVSRSYLAEVRAHLEQRGNG